eukprot:2023026-Pyramimonas_sp.AAC.1
MKRSHDDWDVPRTSSIIWDTSDVDGGPIEPPVSRGQMLVDELIEYYLAGDLSAKKVCALCWHASHAGIREARPRELPPNSSSGHFQR